jgi:hypothetical protein
MADLELPVSLVSTLAEGREAYVAVAAKDGPHVTPELYTWSSGRLWFAAATSTLKANVLPREESAGAVVTAAGRSVVLTGEVTAFDPRDPVGVVRRAGELPRATNAVLSFTVRNAADLLAFGRDVVTGRLGLRPPPARALYALRPTSAALVENDALVGCFGDWSCDPTEGTDDGAVPAGGEAAVAAFPGAAAFPGRWFPDTCRLHVAPAALQLLGLDGTFAISVVVDEYTAPGPAAKRGTLVRGVGHVDGTEPGFVAVEVERVIAWDGVRTRRALARDPQPQH